MKPKTKTLLIGGISVELSVAQADQLLAAEVENVKPYIKKSTARWVQGDVVGCFPVGTLCDAVGKTAFIMNKQNLTAGELLEVAETAIRASAEMRRASFIFPLTTNSAWRIIPSTEVNMLSLALQMVGNTRKLDS